ECRDRRRIDAVAIAGIAAAVRSAGCTWVAAAAADVGESVSDGAEVPAVIHACARIWRGCLGGGGRRLPGGLVSPRQEPADRGSSDDQVRAAYAVRWRQRADDLSLLQRKPHQGA